MLKTFFFNSSLVPNLLDYDAVGFDVEGTLAMFNQKALTQLVVKTLLR
jgi:hypothetical protein